MSDITVDVLSVDGKPAQAIDLPSSVFAANLNIPLIHQVVVAQLAAARQGTHATKTRGMVSGGGAKPWRQKGTGRARHGSRRSPQWTGGGIAHGPQPRSYAQKTPKKMIAAALNSALSERLGDGRFFVLDGIIGGDTPSTRQALEALSVIGEYDTCLVVLHRDEDVAWLSLRNVVNVHALAVDQLNVYDVVANQVVVFTKPALDEFLARFGVVEGDSRPTGNDEAVAEVDEVAETAEEVAEVDKAEEIAEVEEVAEAAQVDSTDGSYRGSDPPEGFIIKANEESKRYHTPSSQWYKRLTTELWFNSVEAAEQAGFTDVMESKK